jgi:hypothetical protein
MNFQGMGCRRYCKLVSPSVGVLLGNMGMGVRLQGTVRDSGSRAPEMEHLSLWELF